MLVSAAALPHRYTIPTHGKKDVGERTLPSGEFAAAC